MASETPKPPAHHQLFTPVAQESPRPLDHRSQVTQAIFLRLDGAAVSNTFSIVQPPFE